MNLQEQTNRIKKMMGILTEQDSVTPTQEPTISGLFKMLEQNGYQRYTDQSKVNQDFGNNKFILGKLEFMYGNPEERTFFYKGKTDNKIFAGRQTTAVTNEKYTNITTGSPSERVKDMVFRTYVFSFPLTSDDHIRDYNGAVNNYILKKGDFIKMSELKKFSDEYLNDYIEGISQGIPENEKLKTYDDNRKQTYLNLTNNELEQAKSLIKKLDDTQKQYEFNQKLNQEYDKILKKGYKISNEKVSVNN